MKSQRPIAWLTLVAFLAGCGTPKTQAVPDFSSQAGKLRKVGVVVDAQVTYRSFDRDDKSGEVSAQAVKDIQAAAVRELSARGYVVTVLPPDEDSRALLTHYKETRGNLNEPFRATSGEIAGAAPLPHAVRLAKKAGVDGVAVVCAADSVSSPGVKFANVAAVVAFVALIVVLGGNNFGGGGFGGPSYNVDFAVLDKKGKLLFYHREAIDLTDVNSVGRASVRFADDVQAAREQQ